MERPPIGNPRRAMAIWLASWLCGLGALAAGNAALYRHVQTLRENDPRVYLAEADRLMKAGNFAGALAQVSEAIERAPKDPLPRQVHGHVLYRFKEWAEAVDAYRAALDLGSRDEGTMTNVLWALIQLKRYDEAIRVHGVPWIEAGVRNPSIVRNVAEAFVRASNWAGGLPYIELALELNPGDIYLMTQLEQAYRNTGDTARAEQLHGRIGELERAGGT